MKTKVIHAFLWILVCMVLGITCYQCRDLRGYVILSGSMEPVIPTGSAAVVDSSKRMYVQEILLRLRGTGIW